jgi:hypothetical protein
VAHGIDLLWGQRIDGTSITAAEHDLPEVVRCQQPVRAALGGHDNIPDPNGSKQATECVGGDQIVPRIEGAIEVGAKPPTSCQKRLLPGSNRCGPQVVTASAPPGARCRISATKPGLSTAEKTPKTHTTASNDSLGSPVEHINGAQRDAAGLSLANRPMTEQLSAIRRRLWVPTPRAGARTRPIHRVAVAAGSPVRG